jgi:3D (Asp-Asp-Asp) domain-containing protein
MKAILLALLLLMPLQAREMMARVTYYWPNSGGQVGTMTSTGAKAVCGKTIDVDPKIIPYGSKVTIPEMGKTFKAADTGSAVKARTAAKKLGRPDAIVIDVFCANKSVAMQRIKKYPLFMKVKIEK